MKFNKKSIIFAKCAKIILNLTVSPDYKAVTTLRHYNKRSYSLILNIKLLVYMTKISSKRLLGHGLN